MKNLIFTLTITLFIGFPLCGMQEPVELHCPTIITKAKECVQSTNYLTATKDGRGYT